MLKSSLSQRWYTGNDRPVLMIQVMEYGMEIVVLTASIALVVTGIKILQRINQYDIERSK